MTKRRTDDQGRAFAGSQLQIQVYVNRRARELDKTVLAALPDLAALRPRIRWVSPIEAERFAEYRDVEALKALGLEWLDSSWEAFWPRGGPHWDALAVAHLDDGKKGVILVEAKSHPPEVYGNGCQASPASRAKIDRALSDTKRWIGIPGDADWTGPLYQSANRFASLYFFREMAEIPAWLVNVYFVGDPHSPTTLNDWERAATEVKRELRLGEKAVPFSGNIFLPARERMELQDPSAGSLRHIPRDYRFVEVPKWAAVSVTGEGYDRYCRWLASHLLSGGPFPLNAAQQKYLESIHDKTPEGIAFEIGDSIGILECDRERLEAHAREGHAYAAVEAEERDLYRQNLTGDPSIDLTFEETKTPIEDYERICREAEVGGILGLAGHADIPFRPLLAYAVKRCTGVAEAEKVIRRFYSAFNENALK